MKRKKRKGDITMSAATVGDYKAFGRVDHSTGQWRFHFPIRKYDFKDAKNAKTSSTYFLRGSIQFPPDHRVNPHPIGSYGYCHG